MGFGFGVSFRGKGRGRGRVVTVDALLPCDPQKGKPNERREPD